jgi:predicted ester cyclase
MSVEQNKQTVRRVFDEAFNRGELAIIDEVIAPDGVDHQHANEPSFAQHLKAVVVALRTALPDLRFEIAEMIGEGDWVACYSVMTGTNTGPLERPLLPPQGPALLPPTGNRIRVSHVPMIRFQGGKSTDLFHLMDTVTLVGQLGLMPSGAAGEARAA